MDKFKIHGAKEKEFSHNAKINGMKRKNERLFLIYFYK